MPERESRTAPRPGPVSRGTLAARERWVAPHDPSLRERLEVAAMHLRLARLAAQAGVARWVLRREVELAEREIARVHRTLRDARRTVPGRDAAQARVIDRVSDAASRLQRATRSVARLLQDPLPLPR
jgi:hypothetical protein